MRLFPDIQFAVLRGRPTVNRHLRRFGQAAAHYREFPGSVTWAGTFGVRNEIFRLFLAETALPWLVMLDDDIVLTAESNPFLLSDTDVTGPRVVGADGREAHATGLASGAIKFSRRAVDKLGAAWEPPADGTCGCNRLYNACRRAGLAISKAGKVGHRIPMTAWPDGLAQFDNQVMPLGLGNGDVSHPPAGRGNLDAHDDHRAQESQGRAEESAVADVQYDLHGQS